MAGCLARREAAGPGDESHFDRGGVSRPDQPQPGSGRGRDGGRRSCWSAEPRSRSPLRIYLNNDAVTQEYDHILRLDQVHSVFDDLIFELHQMDSTGRRRPRDGCPAHAGGDRAKAGGGRRDTSRPDRRCRAAAGAGRPGRPPPTERGGAGRHKAPGRRHRASRRGRPRLAGPGDPRGAPPHGGARRSPIDPESPACWTAASNEIQAIVALYVAFIVVGGALVAAGQPRRQTAASPPRCAGS